MTIEERLAADPAYHALVRDRQRFAWTLTAVIAAIYTVFLLLIAFDKPLLGSSVTGGSTTWAVVAGFAVLACPIAICATYVRRANREFDARIAALLAGEP